MLVNVSILPGLAVLVPAGDADVMCSCVEVVSTRVLVLRHSPTPTSHLALCLVAARKTLGRFGLEGHAHTIKMKDLSGESRWVTCLVLREGVVCAVSSGRPLEIRRAGCCHYCSNLFAAYHGSTFAS